ncbi:hypothetical protein ODR38_05910 [Pediococcus acidilactici]
MAFEKLNLFGDEGSAAPPKKATPMNKMVVRRLAGRFSESLGKTSSRIYGKRCGKN